MTVSNTTSVLQDIAELENSTDRLQHFVSSPEFGQLAVVEQNFLNRYLVSSLQGDITIPKLKEFSGVNDPSLGLIGGGGLTVKEGVKKMHTDGMEINYFIATRPYLFFHQPENNSFYFFKNPGSLGSDIDYQVLDVKSGVWKKVVDLTPFTGSVESLDNEESRIYDGAIKAHHFVIFFNPPAEEKDKLDIFYGEETRESQGSDSKYYHESQTNGYCQIHAANAFQGYQAVIPSKLQEYVTERAQEFSQGSVEDLLQGAEEQREFNKVFTIENGTDMGMMVAYIQHLSATSQIESDVTNLKSGSIKLIDDNLVFESGEGGPPIPITAEFLNSIDRCMFGTYAPIHALTMRKNTDGTWNVIDSFHEPQSHQIDLVEWLKGQIRENEKLKGPLTAFPFTFL